MTRTYSGRDDEINTIFYTPLKGRTGLTKELFSRYWKDVHGPICARLPGLWQYKQFHLSPDTGGVWPAPNGISRHTPPDEQIDGIAELTFRSTAERQAWVDAGELLMRDEHNCFDETIGYLVTDGRARTYVDDTAIDIPNGALGLARYHVLLKNAPNTPLNDVRAFLVDQFAEHVSRDERVLKFRLHQLDPYTKPAPPAPNVFHTPSPERQIHAAFEITFDSRLELAEFLADSHYANATRDMDRYIRQMSVFPEREAYSLVEQGHATLLGVRSPSVARTIVESGAVSNLTADVMALMLGKA